MIKIQYTTVEQQIEKLKSQHLIFLDEKKAKRSLKTYGYTNLIKNYRAPYIIDVDGKKVYRSGVTFDQICSLYIFDKNLRNSVMASMQDLEEHIKEVAADVISKSFGTHQDNYLAFRNYKNKQKRKYCFTLPGILDTLKKTLDTDKDPIHYYMDICGVVPPWILFKSIYFTTIVNFIDLFKSSEQQQLSKVLYRENKLGLSDEALCKLMMDTLFICKEYRNIAAHGGQIYNYQNNTPIHINNENINIYGFSKLLFLLKLFKYESPFLRLDAILNQELNRHCNYFPQDATYLGHIMNMDIIPQYSVYISEKSNKYHFNPHCSGIKNAIMIPLEEANKNGFIPCKKCISNEFINSR